MLENTIILTCYQPFNQEVSYLDSHKLLCRTDVSNIVARDVWYRSSEELVNWVPAITFGIGRHTAL